MTLEEAFIGDKPEFGHLRIFECLVYCHVPVEKRMNLEQTAENGFFVGYNETSKAYKVYIPALKKMVVQRDMRFEEDRVFRKSCGFMPVEVET